MWVVDGCRAQGASGLHEACASGGLGQFLGFRISGFIPTCHLVAGRAG